VAYHIRGGGVVADNLDEASGPSSIRAATLAMANAGPGTNGSQFFIGYEDSRLPPNYTVFDTIDQTGLATLDKTARSGRGRRRPGRQARHRPHDHLWCDWTDEDDAPGGPVRSERATDMSTTEDEYDQIEYVALPVKRATRSMFSCSVITRTSAPPGIRTPTEGRLRPLPLPIGLPARGC
jgi:cyclophilin family peptidyl-prolyl cis-trans isomerase